MYVSMRPCRLFLPPTRASAAQPSHSRCKEDLTGYEDMEKTEKRMHIIYRCRKRRSDDGHELMQAVYSAGGVAAEQVTRMHDPNIDPRTADAGRAKVVDVRDTSHHIASHRIASTLPAYLPDQEFGTADADLSLFCCRVNLEKRAAMRAFLEQAY